MAKTERQCKECGKTFTKRTPLQYLCSSQCDRKRKMNSQKKEKKKFISPVSEKRLNQLKVYRTLRKEFLSRPENSRCPVTNLPATEIHHINGRENDRLNDFEFWIAVSRQGHIWIHANPREAREKGWLL